MFRNVILALMLSLFAAGVMMLAPAVQAAEQTQHKTVTLDVKNMTCAMCPFTVRKALEKVDGVIQAEAKYEGGGVGWAKVTFDPGKTEVAALTQATTSAGYPSSVHTEE